MTEKLNIEQTDSITAHTAEADNDKGASGEAVSYGKFKNAESLLSAYNALQAEFTRRCQRLKELEEKEKSAKEGNPEQNSSAVNAAAENGFFSPSDKNPKERKTLFADMPKDIFGAENKANSGVTDKTAVFTDAVATEKTASAEKDDSIRTVPETSETAKTGFEQSASEAKTDSKPNTGDDDKEKEAENAPVRVISAKEREDVLKEYLESVLQKKTGAILMEGAGASLKTPRSRPKTVEEAGRLFRESFGKI